ncbi:ester cyclase [Haloarcula nitratireducens]|uniref:Ester cyclase n=1 Tax=Haloarcula nitratireducens TaxID=2487749 RepID=A0AAW4P8T8_9EURY|nr:ester cyclase [Halomicroarcula nitratireducens]MBX0294289.1 ester cyclase [Halomicroarcula nitratireducens]
MATATPDVERLMRDYQELWNEKQYGKIPEVTAESITVHDPGHPEVVTGRDGLEAYLRELHEGFPDFHVTIEEMLTSGDIVMAKWTVTGTHEGQFGEFPPTGNAMELEGMDKVLLEDGKILEHRAHYDTREMLEQLGLTER